MDNQGMMPDTYSYQLTACTFWDPHEWMCEQRSLKGMSSQIGKALMRYQYIGLAVILMHPNFSFVDFKLGFKVLSWKKICQVQKFFGSGRFVKTESRARICRSFKETRYRFSAWRAGTKPYLTYWPARLHRLAKSIPRNRFLSSINFYKYRLKFQQPNRTNSGTLLYIFL